MAQVYAKYFTEDESVIIDWARSQTDYLLGENPLRISYLMGLSDSYPNHPHNVMAHASFVADPQDPVENRHLIWGALIDGPHGVDDDYVDDPLNNGANEVAIDHNSAFVAAVAGNYHHHGGNT